MVLEGCKVYNTNKSYSMCNCVTDAALHRTLVQESKT